MSLEHADLRFICVEGDSKDKTWEHLHQWAVEDSRVTLLTCNTGAPRYGSIVSTKRFKVLAQVFNTALDAVDTKWSDYVLFTPSDIYFNSDVISRLMRHNVALVAPFYFMRDNRFYDTWGFTKDGMSFKNFRREQTLQLFGSSLIEMDTVGGMVLFESNLLRSGCRYTEDEVDRGFCKQVSALGHKVWADPTTFIQHR